VDEKHRFEAAIAASPDDEAAYLVYADWLQQRGDPRGELIVLQHRGQDDAARGLLQRHAEHFYGGLSARPSLLDVTWHLGFFRACRFSLDDDRGPGTSSARSRHSRSCLHCRVRGSCARSRST
jgi:uncharacterized protein (TIGR02996 family)